MIENYILKGVNIIAVNEQKQAIFPWKIYQTKEITLDEINRQLTDHKAKGIAVICGAVSGNLEAIDVDTKYQTYDLWEKLKEKIPVELYNKLHIVSTKNKGYHLLYRCEVIEGNKKLAQRYATPDEMAKNPNIKTHCIIETRGEAGYVVAPPTDGYTIVQDWQSIQPLREVNTFEFICHIARETFRQIHLL